MFERLHQAHLGQGLQEDHTRQYGKEFDAKYLTYWHNFPHQRPSSHASRSLINAFLTPEVAILVILLPLLAVLSFQLLTAPDGVLPPAVSDISTDHFLYLFE